MKASDEKGGNKGLLKAELEGIFGKPKPNVVSVTWNPSQYSAMNNWWKMTEIDESLLQEGIFLSRLDSYFPHLNFSETGPSTLKTRRRLDI